MPLFRDPDRRRHYLRSPEHDHEQPTTGSSQPELNDLNHCEIAAPEMATNSMHPTALNPPKAWANDREELIHRIKESSPWRLQHMSPDRESNDLFVSRISRGQSQPAVREHGDRSLNQEHHIIATEELGSPADIQRPRSALHSGDFNEGATHPHDSHSPRSPLKEQTSVSSFADLRSSPTTPWFGAPALPPDLRKTSTSNEHYQSNVIVNARARAPSVGSFSSSYVLKAPTSPLVYQANNTDLDVSGPLERANRRRTLPPETFGNLQFSPPSDEISHLGSPSPGRQQDIFTNQTPLPRRSLTSAYSLQLAPSPGGQIPPSRVRRPSFISDISSKSHAPMVGSYEESILCGRMSMNPSKPLDFMAQIGVLGKGKCKGHLKCPPHITVPFPAVFYSYPTSGCGRSISDDNPSPYVGTIDLENALPKENPNPNRRRRRHPSPRGPHEGIAATEGPSDIRTPGAESPRLREKKNRRSESPKCPPGGSYRIPQQGQLQIIIKNPHKTAVKLFLVPYDLTDMEPGTKTFIRQRSYSAGPIIDMPLSARKNLGTDRPEASLNPTQDPQDKPTLRYLIHLHICCPARGRFYLHPSIRVVFANRVPDGKEKLRNEIQIPEPRYTPYKPASISSTASANTSLGIEQTSRGLTVDQGAIPHLRPHVSSPSQFPSQLDVRGSLNVAGGPENTPSSHRVSPYNKLTKDNEDYGRHPFISNPSSPEPGESLLSKRLRGLDVRRQEITVDEQHPRKLGFYDRPSPTHNHHPR
ncbi:hypothetical protein N7517_000458 [Penicillium concentricum]|uniref:Atos-like conserved domain-containing protein n=1 Tax=Penicillium concentricum TaxID=293559 RepID=A0A9W9SQC0_9EURO|nr:uncharacterized protein N7517_000458 [Penicillium concentricum]KAJ5382547.1 hypothetical protein N7517_000458 [Penicillium concentricum]